MNLFKRCLPDPRSWVSFQVGLTTAYMQKDLNNTVWNTGLYTITIIAFGIVLTLLLANHIITPLQRLARAARRFSEGEPYIEVSSNALDEVGQLTRGINTMALTLQQREEAISTYVDTITNAIEPIERAASNRNNHYINPGYGKNSSTRSSNSFKKNLDSSA